VAGVECPADIIEVGRTYGNPYIRITHHQSKPESAEPGHSEAGYPTRDEFARALSTRLPPFYACGKFVFKFGRDQIWPTTDSFTVSVDAQGNVVSVSELKQDEMGE
jgi:hypothetical protein